MYLSISASVFSCGFAFLLFSAVFPVFLFSSTNEILEHCAESNKVAETWASRVLEGTWLLWWPLTNSWFFSSLTYWVAFPRNMMLFNTFTDVRLQQEKKQFGWVSKHVVCWHIRYLHIFYNSPSLPPKFFIRKREDLTFAKSCGTVTGPNSWAALRAARPQERSVRSRCTYAHPKANSTHFPVANLSSIGHFWVLPGLCIKKRLGAQPLMWK